MKILLIRTYPTLMDVKSYNSQEIGLAKAYIDSGNECDIIYYHGFLKTVVQNVEYKGENIKIYWIKSLNFLNNGIFFGLDRILKNYDFYQVSEYDQLLSRKIYKKYQSKTYIYQGVYDSAISIRHNVKDFVFDRFFLNKRLKKTTIIAKSKLAADSLRKKGFSSIHVVGVGMDFSRFKIVRGNLHVNNDVIKLLYIGKIEDRRNVLMLLDVVKIISEKQRKVKLTIVGKGEKKYVKKVLSFIGDNNLNDYVEIIDGLPQDELPFLYLSHDLFLLPTKYEIFGMVLLESMYFGLPVVTSENGGSTTLIPSTDYGRIIKSFSIHEWANEIISLFEDKELRETMSKNAKRNVEDNFSWDSIAKKIKEVIAL